MCIRDSLEIVPKEKGKLRGVVKSVLFKGVHYETVVETRSGTSISSIGNTISRQIQTIYGSVSYTHLDVYKRQALLISSSVTSSLSA